MAEIDQFKTRKDLHIARKLWHVMTVSAMALIFHYSPSWLPYTLLVVVTAFGLIVDFARLRNPKVNERALKIMGPLMRQSEVHSIAGTTSLLIGVLIIVSIFEKPIVELSLWFLAFADPAASYFGLKYGKDKIWGGKSLQGTFAGFAVCAFVAFIYFLVTGYMSERLVIASLLSGLVGGLAESIPVANLDDNFVMPTLSAAGLWMIFTTFGGYIV